VSPAERLFRQRLERRAAALAPDLQREILRGYTRLRAMLSEPAFEAFLRSEAAERLFREVLTPQVVADVFAPLRATLRDGVEAAGRATLRELPARAQGAPFGVLNPEVVEGVRTLDSRVLSSLTEETREVVRAVVENGLRDGVGPRTIARELRQAVGLAPNQLQAIDNFRRLLEDGDAEALTRALRDTRFDRTVEKALAGDGLTEAQIDRMTDAYRKRMVAFNAETHARTAALDAQKLGQELTWQQAVARGDVDGERLFKRWSAVLDSRVRPEHRALHGEVVRHDEAFSNGEMVPGESTYNCRCMAIYTTVRDPASARKPGQGYAEVGA
jgi:SPP1 gp7 family putative phage head morphogenesis protein